MRKIGRLSNVLSRMMYDKPKLIHVMKVLRYFFWIFLIKIRSANPNLKLDVNKILWVDPGKIKHVSLELNPNLNMGRIVGGNWDKSKSRFEDAIIYKSFIKHFNEGKKWEETEFYDYLMSEIKQGKVLWDCKTITDVNDRMKKIDNLYYDIKTHGFILGREGEKKGYSPYYDPMEKHSTITLNIGRTGELFFNDGRHRLSIVKILNIKIIPIKVNIRHVDWIKFRKELLVFARKNSGRLYHPLTHPDLQDIPSRYDSHRFDLLVNNMGVQKGTLLDIGAQFGYFCIRFEEQGFDCYAVEIDPMAIYFLKQLRNIERKKFKIIQESIFDIKKDETLQFDVILALNIFHHFLKSKDLYEKLIDLLKRIKTKELYFQAHKTEEPQMIGSYKNYKPDEFADFISKYTNMKYRFIGNSNDGRRIYKFFTCK